jgi:hypothetical protein
MSVVLIDGVKYLETIPENEQELEDAVREHSSYIFGPDSIYLERKQIISSASGIKGIPDGIVFVAAKPPEWHIVEVELSDHPLHDHVIPQVSKFIQAIRSQDTRKQITKAIHSEINSNPALKTRIIKIIGESSELYELISDAIDKSPILTLIVEKGSQQIQEGLDSLAHPNKKIIEFRTYNREGVGSIVHAHLFEPLHSTPLVTMSEQPRQILTQPILSTSEPSDKIGIRDLIKAGLLKPGQRLFRRYKGKDYLAYVLDAGALEIVGFGKANSLSMAAVKITGKHINGWRWWLTEHKGVKVKLGQLRSMLI